MTFVKSYYFKKTNEGLKSLTVTNGLKSKIVETQKSSVCVIWRSFILNIFKYEDISICAAPY